MEREQVKETLARGTAAEGSTPTRSPQPPTAESTKAAPGRNPAELLAALGRMERLLEDLRGQVETVARERRHREFSPARLIGAILQALMIGFVIAALADWVYGAKEGPQLVKLAFAGVLQLGALTAFVLAREKA